MYSCIEHGKKKVTTYSLSVLQLAKRKIVLEWYMREKKKEKKTRLSEEKIMTIIDGNMSLYCSIHTIFPATDRPESKDELFHSQSQWSYPHNTLFVYRFPGHWTWICFFSYNFFFCSALSFAVRLQPGSRGSSRCMDEEIYKYSFKIFL